MTASLGGATNLTAATISTKLYLGPLGSAANLQYMLVGTIGTKTCTAYVGYTSSFSSYTSTFANYSLNVSTIPGIGSTAGSTTAYCSDGTTATFDALQITSIGYQIGAGSTAPFATTTAWLDSITITGSTPTVTPMTFDTTTPFTIQTYSGGPIGTATATYAATCP
jgi:hypothetical protein